MDIIRKQILEIELNPQEITVAILSYLDGKTKGYPLKTIDFQVDDEDNLTGCIVTATKSE